MIVPRTSELLFRTALYVSVPLLGLIAYDVAIVLLYQAGYLAWAALEQIPLSLFGSVIGVILAFRNSTSYARWWEARTLWGSIVNSSRSWARGVTTVMRASGDQAGFAKVQRQMVYYQIAWVHALRQQLRGLELTEEIKSVLTPEEFAALAGQKNAALAIQQWQSLALRRALDAGWIDRAQWRAMNQTLDDLVNAQGGAERIKNTPMPRQYDFLPRFCAHLFCFLLPLAIVPGLGWFTPLGSTLVGFIFLALDKIGRDLEAPFDNKIHDVPLTAICRTVEINLRQLLGETALPPEATPVDQVLW